ncbi:type III-B CRISPR-associated protein Cas10/Cmr2 [Flectobacillus major]|uniref:type III-B CRISPR-associated protein Cas10/Cmr2 n=1 Tax=Flectobacillus major TaxID=103 RepID=UPI0003FFBCCE|nr:type III-B CRISPR-associated protein Cas10/Cmr2 [Flectobacillus major]
MSKHLFLFTIGPVQTFIAQARKTQDLYAGSSILADIIHYALGYIKCNQGKIISPYYEDFTFSTKIDETNERSFPNRIVASFDIDKEAVKNLGNTLEALVKTQFETLAKNKFDQVFQAKDKPLGLCEQIKDFLEVYWVAVEYQEDNYQEAYQSLIKKMAMLKSIRPMKSFAEKGRKCDLNGVYNVKVYRKTAEEEKEKKSCDYIKKHKLFATDNFIIKSDFYSISPKQLQAGEGLSAISFLKRLYKNNPDEEKAFPSTAKIALLNLLNDATIAGLVKEYKQVFKKGHFDEQLLFDELTEEKLIKKGIKLKDEYYESEETLQEAIRQLNKLRDKIVESAKKENDSEKNGYAMSKYYAILSFDGDDMGKKLSSLSLIEQNELAKKLSKYSDELRKYIDDRKGKTVYAGGDDFLALVNLTYLEEVLRAVKSIFTDISVSIAITIAHYKTPLQKVLLLNRSLLQETKTYFKEKRNDFDISKSGTGISFVSPSGVLGTTYIKGKEDTEIFFRLLCKFQNKDLSPSILFKFEQSIKNIIGTELTYEAYQTQLAILQSELKRLTLRSCNKTNENKVLELLQDASGKPTGLPTFLSKQAKEIKANTWTIDTDNFFGFIKVATKIAQEIS